MNESEPLMRCREVALHSVKSCRVCYSDKYSGTCLLAMRQASFRRHELYPGLVTELGNLHVISTIIYSKKSWLNYRNTPLFENINSEGIEI
jgi:hypothetical protein